VPVVCIWLKQTVKSTLIFFWRSENSWAQVLWGCSCPIFRKNIDLCVEMSDSLHTDESLIALNFCYDSWKNNCLFDLSKSLTGFLLISLLSQDSTFPGNSPSYNRGGFAKDPECQHFSFSFSYSRTGFIIGLSWWGHFQTGIRTYDNTGITDDRGGGRKRTAFEFALAFHFCFWVHNHGHEAAAFYMGGIEIAFEAAFDFHRWLICAVFGS